MDSVTALTLLDLSAPFDTIGYLILFGSDTFPLDTVRNIDVVFDSDLNFRQHIYQYVNPVSIIYVISVEFGANIYIYC